MKKAIAFVLLAALGSGWHFLYTLLPCPLSAVLAPVNESIWEHLKLLFYPPLLLALAETVRGGLEKRRLWSGVLFSVVLMPVVLSAAYYLLTAGFGVQTGLVGDLLLYYSVLALGFWVACRLSRREREIPWFGPVVIAAGLLGVAFTVFTFAAPPLPIFIPPA